jgi:hypothetical protein
LVEPIIIENLLKKESFHSFHPSKSQDTISYYPRLEKNAQGGGRHSSDPLSPWRQFCFNAGVGRRNFIRLDGIIL